MFGDVRAQGENIVNGFWGPSRERWPPRHARAACVPGILSGLPLPKTAACRRRRTARCSSAANCASIRSATPAPGKTSRFLVPDETPRSDQFPPPPSESKLTRVFLVPDETPRSDQFGQAVQTFADPLSRPATASSSSIVGRPVVRVRLQDDVRPNDDRQRNDRQRNGRTTKPHGLSGPELNRLSSAVHFMESRCPRPASLWWLTTESDTPRDQIADIWKRITRLQGKYDLPAWSVLVFETSGGIHAHIVFISIDDIGVSLRRAKKFGAAIHVAPVTDAARLTNSYLAKERTPQAGYRREHLLGGRVKGSHRLQGGGDRVRLSRELERDAIEAGAVQPWQRTNAKRSRRGGHAPSP
jgi:hypothetical protein